MSIPTTSAARRAYVADLAYANVNVVAKARLKKEAGLLLDNEPITIDRADYTRLAQPGNQFTLLLSEENSQLMVNIGRADDQQPQRWVLPNNLPDKLLLGLDGDFIRPEDVPVDLRFDGATHILRLSDGQITRFQSFQVKADEVELLGYSMDLYDTQPDYKISDNFLNTSKYSDLPLNLGDEFEFVNEIVSTDRSERIETHTHLHWDAYGVLETPTGTFNALRFTSRDTSFSYQGSAKDPSSQRVSQRVGWITKEGVLFDGQIQAYDPVSGQATLVQVNYQTITDNTPPTNVSLSSGTLNCAITSVTLTASATGGTSYTLSDGQANTTGQFVVNSPGSYTVTVANGSGLTATASAVVTQDNTPPTVSVSPGSATLTTASPSVSLTASGMGAFLWSTGETSPVISATTSGNYSVTLTNASGCTASASVSVIGSDLTVSLELPQANFAASGSAAVGNLVVKVFEVAGLPTSSGNVTITLTAPIGYSLAFGSSLTSINVSGGSTVAVNNGQWTVTNSVAGRQLTLTMNSGDFIRGGGESSLGFSITRTTANSGSTANVTVNVQDDLTKTYDGNLSNNVYARIISGL